MAKNIAHEFAFVELNCGYFACREMGLWVFGGSNSFSLDLDAQEISEIKFNRVANFCKNYWSYISQKFLF